MSLRNASKISDQAFWQAIDELVATSAIVIDRPKNSPHPRFPEIIYPFDYGYLDGTVSGDGQGIDVWLGSEVAQRATAVICTVDLWKRDMEIKLLLGCNAAEIETIFAFLNNAFQRAVVLQVRHG